MTSTASFYQNLLSFIFPSTLAPKWPILASQYGMDHQKSTILLIFDTLSLGGYGGHPMRPKLDLKDKGQMNTQICNFKSNLTCIFLSVGAKLKKKHFASDTLYQLSTWFASSHITNYCKYGWHCIYVADTARRTYICTNFNITFLVTQCSDQVDFFLLKVF